MPALYRGECDVCGHHTPETSGGYGAIVLDEESDSAHAHPDDARIIVLAHPGESAVLAELGQTHTSATLAGRYLVVDELFCTVCGHLYEARRLGAARLSLGCVPPVGIGLVGGVAIGLAVGRLSLGVLAGLLLMVFVSSVVDWALDRYVRTRFAERAHEFDLEPVCPECGERAGRKPGTSAVPLPCPSCGRKTMRLECIGIS